MPVTPKLETTTTQLPTSTYTVLLADIRRPGADFSRTGVKGHADLNSGGREM
jgi:hypothetical protein